jgi:hypothetical protein
MNPLDAAGSGDMLPGPACTARPESHGYAAGQAQQQPCDHGPLLSDAIPDPASVIQMLRRMAEIILRTLLPSTAGNLIALADAIEAATKPPQPEEPTGKWAVVTDRDGDVWVRDERDPGYPWACGSSRCAWDVLQATFSPLTFQSPGVES